MEPHVQVNWARSEAQWIRAAVPESAHNVYLAFARRFHVPVEAPVVVHITAVSQYRLSVNGREVGRGPAPSSPGRRYYDTYSLESEWIRPGENLVTVLLHHDGATTETVQGFQYGEPGLLVAIEGEGVSVASDASWHVRRPPEYSSADTMVSKWGGYKEVYHGERREDWESPDYDHSEWPFAETAGPPLSEAFATVLAPLDVPRLEETWRAPVRVTDLAPNLGRIALDGAEGARTPVDFGHRRIDAAPGEYGAAPAVTLDFGTMVVGYPEIVVEGAACVVELWYGETLDLYRLDVVNLPEGGGTWQAFQRRAFRYLRIVFIVLEGPVSVVSVRQRNTWYAYDGRGRIELSDARLARMVEVSKHTLRANTSYHYEDCPIREQALWIMDMRIMARINAYLFGNLELTAKCLRQAFAIQRPDGSVASTGPKDSNMFHPDFMLHLVGTLREHFEFSGDRALVEELYPAVQRMDAYLSGHRPDGMLLDADTFDRGLPFLDWSDAIDKGGTGTIFNALYKDYLEDLGRLAEALGRPDDAAAHRAAAQGVGAAVHELLFDPDLGLYVDTSRGGKRGTVVSQQANLAAIYAGIAPPSAIDGIMHQVWDSDRYPRPYGPSYYLVVMDALARIGRYDAMLEVMREYWGEMLDRGATAWWEVFNPRTPRWVYPHPFLGATPTYELDWIPISACHGWSGIPGYAVPRYLLGVDLSQVHRGRIVVDPGLPGLFDRAEYAVPVAGGILSLEFRRQDDRYRIGVLDRPEGIVVETVDAVRTP